MLNLPMDDYLLVLNAGMDGLLGVAGMISTSDDWDHSRKFPTFSTSKITMN